MDQPVISPPRRRDRVIIALCAVIGAAAVAIIWFQLRDKVLNVVTYRLISPPLADAVTTWILPGVVIVAMLAFAARLALRRPDGPAICSAAGWSAIVPAAALTVGATAAMTGWTPGFWTIAATCLLTAVLAERLAIAAQPRAVSPASDAPHHWCLAVLIAVIVAATVWHARMQYDFWRHFMLGYADFGLYTRELEYCLYYNDLADRWANTRMAYHFEPLFYLLAPAYALFRSPLFLMVIGPLALNVAALAFYWLAIRRTGSSLIGLIAGVTWLALPSISRMPYANTYGFESVYLAVPLLSFCFAAAHLGRWRTSHLLLALALLCQETMVAVAVGWGIYIALFCNKKRDGIVIAIAAVTYLAVCAGIIIPAISPDNVYVRSEMLGDVTVSQLTSRLSRQAYWALLFALTAPLLPAITRRPRMLIAAAPTLLMLGLIQNVEYLSVKFWHQSSVLPALFICACLGATRRDVASKSDSSGSTTAPLALRSIGAVVGMLAGVLLLHQLTGYSPLAQSWNVQQASPVLRTQDPKLNTINQLRTQYPPSQTRVAATERIAAHLTDYRGLTTIEHIVDYPMLSTIDVVIIDAGDAWDPVIRSDAIRQFINFLQSANLQSRQFGDIWVFADQDVLQGH